MGREYLEREVCIGFSRGLGLQGERLNWGGGYCIKVREDQLENLIVGQIVRCVVRLSVEVREKGCF